ncbi:hypothetical protein L798_00438 [Zootermopsis nevadensis]|uniref:Uncharacterized protein n=1 Tax=Zootermopsis nevadensis TaxID=136037 RepID=A0A067RQ70_ZOONE|nr:hypothetical protein L798_00438 [Zootermopsis nevadensis]
MIKLQQRHQHLPGGEEVDVVLLRIIAYVSPKRWYLPASPHRVTTQQPRITLT